MSENCNNPNCSCRKNSDNINNFEPLKNGVNKLVQEQQISLNYSLDKDTMDEDEDDHYLGPTNWVKEDSQITSNSDLYEKGILKIREFDTGATRDTDKDKLEFARFFCPLVFKRVAEYMHKHRIQPDGDLRDPDNWKKLFGSQHEDVCMDSLMRHVEDVWLIIKGFEKEARENKENALCAIIMNSIFWLHKILKEKYEQTNKNKPTNK